MLKSIAGKVARPVGLMSAILGGAKEMTREHFVRLDAERSRYNSGFYAQRAKDERLRTQVRDSGILGVLSLVDESGALRHKIAGGVLRPKTRKFLTIPVSEEAKFASAAKIEAGDVAGLFLVKNTKRRRFFLVSRDGAGIRVHYVLKESVEHKARPEVMPSRAGLARAAQTACDHFAQAEFNGSRK